MALRFLVAVPLTLGIFSDAIAAETTARCGDQGDTAIVGGLLVALYSYSRFNTPPTCRSSTTAARYYLGVVFYVAMILLVYALCLNASTARDVALESVRHIASIPDGAVPLLLAVLMMSTVEIVSPLTRVDELLRGRCHRLASIPHRLHRLSDLLRTGAYSPPELLRRRVVDALQAADFEERDAVFGGGSSSHQLWTRLTLLIERLRMWKDFEHFSDFYTRHSNQIEALQQRYNILAHQARLSFQTMQRDAVDVPADWSALVEGHRTVFRWQLEALLDVVCALMSRGVLKCGRTEQARDRELGEMGFTVSREGLTMDQRIGILLLISTMLTMFIVVWGNPNMTVSQRIWIAVGASLSNWFAILWAIEPREKGWAIAQPDRPGEPPIKYYVTVALGAGAFGLAIRALARMPVAGSLEQSLRHASEWAGWALVDVATALMIALNTDANRRRWPEWLQGACQAAVSMAVAGFLYWKGLAITGTPASHLIARIGVLGFLIGWLVPSWYKSAPREARVAAANPALRARRDEREREITMVAG